MRDFLWYLTTKDALSLQNTYVSGTKRLWSLIHHSTVTTHEYLLGKGAKTKSWDENIWAKMKPFSSLRVNDPKLSEFVKSHGFLSLYWLQSRRAINKEVAAVSRYWILRLGKQVLRLNSRWSRPRFYLTTTSWTIGSLIIIDYEANSNKNTKRKRLIDDITIVI